MHINKKFAIIISSLFFIFSIILAKFIWYQVEVEKSFLGIRNTYSYRFNWTLFIVFTVINVLFLSFILYKNKVSHILFYCRNILGKTYVRLALFILTFVFFILGLFTPFISSVKFFFHSESITLLDSIGQLYKSDEVFLGTIVLLFSVCFPAAKMVVIGMEIVAGKHKYISYLSRLGKWSMLDVFVIAVFILNLKFDSNLISMKTEIGLIFFAFSVIFSVILTNQLKK